jgi:hypothetical protein
MRCKENTQSTQSQIKNYPIQTKQPPHGSDLICGLANLPAPEKNSAAAANKHKTTSMVDMPVSENRVPPLKLDDGWPESVEEQGLLLLVWRHYITRQYITRWSIGRREK